MSDVSAAAARKNLTELVNRVAYGKERVVLTRHGKRLCALVPLEDLTLLDRVREMAHRRDVSDALSDEARGSTVSWSALKRELGFGE